MVNNTKDSTTTVKVVCAIIFIVFIVSYVFSFQGDLLTMTQNAWAQGQTHYHRGVGVAIITLVLSLVAFIVSLLVRLPQRTFSLIFFPSFLLVGLLTAVNVEGSSVSTSLAWLIASPVMLLLYAFLIGEIKSFQPFLTPLRSTVLLSHPWWTNIFILVCMMTLTYMMGNTDRTLHTRLKVERYCQHKEWDKALETGYPQYDNDSSLTMLRALALANKGEMGDRLFTYDITGGSTSLVPQRDKSVTFLLGNDIQLWRTIGVVPRNRAESMRDFLKREMRRGTVKAAARDYMLCSYLLDRDLKGFAMTLPSYYTINDSLPVHYAEAYVMYCEKYNVNDTLMTNAMKADYADFLATMRAQPTHVLREAAIRSAYFGTYWYYYYKGGSKNYHRNKADF